MDKKYNIRCDSTEERTSTAMIFETMGFRFVKDEAYPWIYVYKLNDDIETFLEEFEPDDIIVEFNNLKVTCIAWIHENVEILI
jgi:hypothetical protein